MRSFRVMLYKADLLDGKYIDDGISIYTSIVNAIGSAVCLNFSEVKEILSHRYSHIEIWWGDIKLGYTGENGEFLGEIFTSTMRQGMSGTVIRPAAEVLKNPKRWDVMEFQVSDQEFEDAVIWARVQVFNNKGYNKKTIGNFFNPFRPVKKPKTDEKNICSVAVQGFCWKAGLFKSWKIYSPIRLWLMLRKCRPWVKVWKLQ